MQGIYLEETPWPLEEVPLCRNHFNFCLKMKSMSAETCCIAVDPQGTPPHMVIATLSTLSSALGGSARGVDACTGCPNIGPLAGPIGNALILCIWSKRLERSTSTRRANPVQRGAHGGFRASQKNDGQHRLVLVSRRTGLLFYTVPTRWGCVGDLPTPFSVL